MIAATLLAALPAQAEPRVWVVRDADSEVVLFGSVYLNHHYLVDGIVGMVFAAGAAAVAMSRARGEPARTDAEAGSP